MFNFAAILKYALEGLAVALAAFFIPQRKVDVKEIVLIALTAAAVFSILDQFSPLTGISARQGAGFGIGLNQVGWGHVHYGGQDPRLSCTCEVDANYLKSQVCSNGESNAKPASESGSEQSSVAADQSTNTTKPTTSVLSRNTTTATSPTGQPPAAGPVVEAFDGFGQTW